MTREIAILHRNTGSDISGFVENLNLLGSTTGGAEVRAGAIALRSDRVDLFTDTGIWDGVSPGMAGVYFVARVAYTAASDGPAIRSVRSRLHVPAHCRSQCTDGVNYSRYKPSPVQVRPNAATLDEVWPPGPAEKPLEALMAGSVILDLPPEIIYDAYVELGDAGHQLLPYDSDFKLPLPDDVPATGGRA